MKLTSTSLKQFVLLLSILITHFAIGQNFKNLKVNQLSDQQMTQVWQQINTSGMSESESMKAMVQKGLQPTEVNAFKKRLLLLQGNQKKNFGAKPFIKDSALFVNDSSWVTEVPTIHISQKYYGYDFFSNPNAAFEPNVHIATPQNYILGTGDILNITLSGMNDTEISAPINKDGAIRVEYVGLISINGLTIEQARQRIFSRMSASYPALNLGKTKLTINLEKSRSIRITVVGETERPGAYQVSAMASVFNVLYLSGGPTEKGSLRAIQLVRDNKVLHHIDLYPFLQKGLLPQNIRLQDQDVLVFAPHLKRVTMAGQLKRPFIYELLPTENLQQALNYAGGFENNAFNDRLKVVQHNGRENVLKDIESNSFANYIPTEADSIYAETMLPAFENNVTILGAVVRPGKYGFTPQLSLKALLHKADGLRADAFLSRAIIKRVSDSKEKSMMAVDLNKFKTEPTFDFPLQIEDSIQIFSKQDIEEQVFIQIDGNVRNPGKILFRNGMTLEDAVLLSGGFTNDAAYHRVELSRLQKDRSDALSNHLVEILKLNIDASLSNQDAKTILAAQDYIYVPKLLNNKFLGEVKLRGEVLFPGNYAIETRDETIKEILTRAGGLTQFGDLKDVQVFRNGTRIGVNLANQDAKDMSVLMLPGDSLFISRNDPFVEVAGAVYNPQLLSFESSGFKSYISAAGGVKNRASLAKAYIQYGNGINRKTSKFLFLRFYPKVKPGSKIIIPEMPEKQKGLSIGEITAFTSILSAMVSLAAILKL